MTKLHIRTFGCRANHYDSEMVRAMAMGAGYEIVDDVANADVAVYNSCAVTSQAERDVRKAVRSGAERNPRLRTVIMGCASALPASRSVLRALPTVEQVIAGADRNELAAALGLDASAESPVVPQDSSRAVLRIQDGCDEHCTFCATTLARGKNRSRPIDALVGEALALSEFHAEIVLTGIHIGTYGADIDSSLGALVRCLVERVPRVRFRLSSVEATEVDAQLAELFVGASGRLAPYLHAPLQSGSDRVLRRMGRHWYTAERYTSAIEALASRLPVFGLGADIITGFPGEGDADFEATVALVERLPFTYLHVFPFSARPGTAATRLADAVDASVARERAARLRALAESKSAAHRVARAGTACDAIVITAGTQRQALTEDYLTVLVRDALPRGHRFSARLLMENGSLVAA